MTTGVLPRCLVACCGAAALAAVTASCAPSGSASAPTPSATAPGARDFFGPQFVAEAHGSFGLDRTRVLPSDDPRFARILRVSYPAGSASQESARTDGTPEGGAQVYLLLRDGPIDVLYLRYYVRFPEQFDFVKGGKLPGLFGGTATAGGRIPDGTDGFSTRYMWRRDGDGEVYAYLPTSVDHGSSLGRGSWTWPTGRWICVEQKVKLNAPGRSDGTVAVWIDDRQVYQVSGLVFRTAADLKVDGLFFSTFFGGSDKSWVTPQNQYADFAAFAVSGRYIAPLSGSDGN